MATSVYQSDIEAVLPRLLALYDTDPFSHTRGLGDRSYWGWKTTDFPNATYQGAANGLARLVAHKLLPSNIAETSVVDRITDMIHALRRIRDRNGSVGEAYPHEASFCVTALVLFDSLVALELLGPRLSEAEKGRWLETLAPLAGFLMRADETHGLISNHLATGAAALYRWQAISGSGEKRGRVLLDRILAAQSNEGWLAEYGGADPGYNSLCLHYLADLHLSRPDLGLAEPLHRSIRFLTHCAHPDGSFGGLYGWRGTRFLVPSAFESLAHEFSEAAALASFARSAIERRATITLAAFDEPNLPVMFNAWAWAAACAQASKSFPVDPLPFESGHNWRKSFDEAGLVIDKGPEHYTVVGWRKGGVVQHYRHRACALVDPGVAARRSDGLLATTQTMHNEAGLAAAGASLAVTARLATSKSAPPTPFQFAILRLLSISVLRFGPINELFKRLLVKRVVTGAQRTPLVNRRTIDLGARLSIKDEWVTAEEGWSRLSSPRPFNAIHMASRGYWQCGDDAPERVEP